MIASAIFIIAALIFINAVYVAAEFSAVGVGAAESGSWPMTGIRSRHGCSRESSHPPRSIDTSQRARSALRSRALLSMRAAHDRGVADSGFRQARRSPGNRGAIDVTVVMLSVLTAAQVILRNWFQIARAPIPDPNRPVYAGADAAVGLAVSPLHQVAERHRPSAAAAHRVAGTGPSPPAFARGSRAADRREP